jgi:hypothetical protein
MVPATDPKNGNRSQRIKTMWKRMLWLCCVFCLPTTAAAADTLVVKNKDGNFAAGQATTWREENGIAVFELQKEAKAEAIAQRLRDGLTGIEVSVSDHTLRFKGAGLAQLLERLASFSLSGTDDPLSDLAGLGGTEVAMGSGEGGGSIRASRPAPTECEGVTTPVPRVIARVQKITPGTFPNATLQLKIRSRAKDGPMKALRPGQVIDAAVVLRTRDGAVDLMDLDTQKNIGAYFLKPNDKIAVVLTQREDKTWEVTSVARVEP